MYNSDARFPDIHDNPASAKVEDEFPGIFRRDKTLILARSSAHLLPCDICVKCSRPSSKVLKRKLTWHSPEHYLHLIGTPVLYFLMAMIVSKTLKVKIGLCKRHASRRAFWILLSWLFLAVTVVGAIMFFRSTSLQPRASTGYFLLGVAGLPFTLIFAWIASNQTVRPVRITKEEAHIVGAKEPYLAHFPSI